MGLSRAFTWAARKTTAQESDSGGGRGTPSAETLDPYWRTALPRRLDELVESWRDPPAQQQSPR